MSMLGDVLELLHSADEPKGTLRCVVRIRRETRGQEEAARRHAERSRGTASVAMVVATAEARSERPTHTESVYRLWFHGRQRVREEADDEGRTRLGVRDGDTWWIWDDYSGAITNDGDAHHQAGIGQQVEWLLDPGPLLAVLRFGSVRRATVGGRDAFVVRAVERAAGDRLVLITLPFGYDEYELAVDAERGVVLRAACLLDGREVTVFEMVELAFDEEFPADTFVFAPPAGETVQRAQDRFQHHDMTLEEVAERASFTVFAPTGLALGWRLWAMYVPRSDRPPVAEAVHLHLHRHDAAHAVSITERTAAAGDPAALSAHVPADQWETRRVDGLEARVYAGERGRGGIPGPLVVLEREGTQIEISGQGMEIEALLELAGSLEPAPTDRPRITE